MLIRKDFIDAKCRPYSHTSDTNRPEGDTKPPGGDNPWELLFSSSINSKKFDFFKYKNVT